jgi:hypothetical protein
LAGVTSHRPNQEVRRRRSSTQAEVTSHLPHSCCRPPARALVFLGSAHPLWPSSSILVSSDTGSTAGLVDATSYRPSSIILGRRLAGIGHSPALRCVDGRRVKNACYKPMFQVFDRYVIGISCGCCKSRSGCCICSNVCTRML